MSIDLLFVTLQLSLGLLVVGFVHGKDRITPGIREDDKDKDFSRIRCPACKWRPTRDDVWACSPGCGEVWNTFATRGECPGCQRFWAQTQCTRCGTWSDHDDWYEDPESES